MPEPQKTHRIRPAILQRSRDFRHPLTRGKAKVWQAVRNRRVGSKIRRQNPIGRFIADFRLGDTSCPLCRPIRVPGRGW
jgi:very-short-patch-repair endonuclease